MKKYSIEKFQGLVGLSSLLFTAFLVVDGLQTVGKAQITPTPNDAGTVINQNANTINITGGTPAQRNLFHSFEKFGVNENQTANFISNPSIQNILGRVTGGDASIINGLIQVTGGNSNLYLMNPAGIIFGSGARLDIPGSFTATTANGIGFGDRWFNATGKNNYAALVGNPNAFAFTMSQPGAIINAGKLAVGEGKDLTLLGGTVANTGELKSSGGNITLAAIPGERLVRISQQGNVLSLDVRSLDEVQNQPREWKLDIPSLPKLLTGGNVGNATNIQVNDDGTVSLTGSGAKIYVDREVNAISTGTINASGTTQEKPGGTVQIFNHDNVGYVYLGGNIASDGGNISIGNQESSYFVTLTGDVSLSTGKDIEGDIIISGNIFSDSISPSRSLEIIAGKGDVNVNSTIGGSSSNLLNRLSISGKSVAINSVSTQGDLELQAQESLTFDSLNAGGNMRLESQKTNLILNNTQLSSSGNMRLESQDGDLIIEDSQLSSSENIQLLAQKQVQIKDTSSDNTSLVRADEDLYIQGKEGININALNSSLSWFKSSGDLSLVSDGVIIGNGRFGTSGDFSTRKLSGEPTGFNITSITSNGIISSQGDVTFGDYKGVSLKVEAGGNITATGNIKIEEKNPSIFGDIDLNKPVLAKDQDIPILANSPALILRAGVTQLQNSPNIPTKLGGETITSTANPSSSGSITVNGDITTNQGPVILSATGDITTGNIITEGQSYEDFQKHRGFLGGYVNLSSGRDIQVKTIDTSDRNSGTAGDITIKAAGIFRAIGYFIPSLDPKDNNYLNNREVFTTPTDEVPTSIQAFGTVGFGAKIDIQHGGNSFKVGPAIIYKTKEKSIRVDPQFVASQAIRFIDAEFKDENGKTYNESEVIAESKPLTLNDLPDSNKTSFTAGAIAVVDIGNVDMPVSFRDRTFSESASGQGYSTFIQVNFIPSNSSEGNNIVAGESNSGTSNNSSGTQNNSGTNSDIVNNPLIERIQQNTLTNGSSSSTGDTSSNSSGVQDGGRTDRGIANNAPIEEIQQNAQINRSSSLPSSNSADLTLDRNRANSSQECNATQMKPNSDRTIELTGSCVPKKIGNSSQLPSK